MAQQALIMQAATDGRFVLGLGLSHPAIVAISRPLASMQEYLGALSPLIDSGA